MLAAADELGAPAGREGERVNVEFVSANPTGPLTAAGGRHAAYGDAVARVLELAGDEVEREYYLNDVGGQVRRFAESIAARMRGAELPEDGYEGAYVEELARELADQGVAPDDLEELERLGVERMRGDDRGDAGALRRPPRQLVLGARALRLRRASRRRSTSCASAATSTRARARSGCAPPTSATTRTAS